MNMIRTGRDLLESVTFVAATATVHTELLQRHRMDLRNAAELAEGLLAELRVAGLAKSQLSRLLAAARKADALGEHEWKQLVADLRALTTTSRRAASLSTVVGTLANLQALERQAFGLKPFELPDPAIGDPGKPGPRRKGVRVEFADVPHRDTTQLDRSNGHGLDRSNPSQSAP